MLGKYSDVNKLMNRKLNTVLWERSDVIRPPDVGCCQLPPRIKWIWERIPTAMVYFTSLLH